VSSLLSLFSPPQAAKSKNATALGFQEMPLDKFLTFRYNNDWLVISHKV
jgi:hypothetical protein